MCEHYIKQKITYFSTSELNITLAKAEIFLTPGTDFSTKFFGDVNADTAVSYKTFARSFYVKCKDNYSKWQSPG